VSPFGDIFLMSAIGDTARLSPNGDRVAPMRIQDERELGLLIREHRKRLGLDQAELATRVGVSRQWIVEVEKGKPRAEVGLLLRTLRVLGVTLHAEEERAQSSGDASPSSLIDIDWIVERGRKPGKGT